MKSGNLRRKNTSSINLQIVQEIKAISIITLGKTDLKGDRVSLLFSSAIAQHLEERLSHYSPAACKISAYS
jgi:hypothetical protein